MIEIDIYTLLYVEYITSKNLLNSKRNSTRYTPMTYMRIESEKRGLYIYICQLYNWQYSF